MKRLTLQSFVVVVVATVFPSSAIFAQNLLINGSFEQGPGWYERFYPGDTGLPGWQVVINSIDYCEGWQCSEGAFCIDLDGQDEEPGGLAQTFITSPGTTYVVKFDLAGNTGSRGGEHDYPRLKKLRVAAAGQSADFEFDTTGHDFWSMGWVRRTWQFKANSDFTTLEFYSLSEPATAGCGPAIDNVVVTGPSDLVTSSFSWNGSSGGANFQYEVRGSKLEKATTAKLFWATGPTLANVIPDAPVIFTHDIPVGASGLSGLIPVPGANFANPRATATYVLLALDYDPGNPKGVVDESDEQNNVAAIPVNGPDLVAVGLAWNTTSTALDARYRIDGGALPVATSAKLFWANGTSVANILPPGTPISDPEVIAEGTGPTGVTTFSADPDKLKTPPTEATHILLVLDYEDPLPDGRVKEAREDNNSVAVPFDQVDLAAMNLSLDLTARSAMCTYRVSGKAAPLGTKIGVYWAIGESEDEIIATAAEQTLPRYDVGAYQFYVPQLTAPEPDATHVLLVIDPPPGAVDEANERNNVFPFPIAPVPPRLTIVTTAAGSSPAAASQEPLWRKRPYNVWLQVENNWEHDISVRGNWTEALPTQPELKETAQGGDFATQTVPGNQTVFLPFGPGISGTEFLHTWDWIPAEEPKTLSQVALDVINTISKELLAGLLDALVKGVGSAGLAAYDALEEYVANANALLDVSPQAIVRLDAKADWWPAVLPAGSAQTLETTRTLPISVRNEQREAYVRYWGYIVLSRHAADLFEILPPSAGMPYYVAWLQSHYQQLASKEYGHAVDPPDTNFTQIALPITNRPPDLDSMPEGPMKRLLLSVLDIGSFNDAQVTALNRAQAAEAVGALDWQARQLTAAAGNLRAVALLHSSAVLLTKEASPEIQQIINTNKQSLVPTLQQRGLAQKTVMNLMALGWTPAQIEAYRMNLTELGTSVLDEVGLTEMSHAMAACVGLADSTAQLSEAVAIRRGKLGVVPSVIPGAQQQQLVSTQDQIEALLAGSAPGSNILAQLSSYLSACDEILDQSANPEAMAEARAFGHAAFGALLQQTSGAENYAKLRIRTTTNGVWLTWPALSSLVLETAQNLSVSNWSAMGVQPTNALGQMQLTLVPGGETAFFRLRKESPVPTVSASMAGTNVGGTFFVTDPHITGMILDGTSVSNLVGGFVTPEGVALVDLSAGLSPYFRRFSLGRAQLDQINGAALQDGIHTFRLKALNATGSVLSSLDFSLHLDAHAPMLLFSNLIMDMDSSTPGIQVAEYSTLRFRCGISDAGGVQALELLMNSNVVAVGSVFPWSDFAINAPRYAADSNTFRFQARGTDVAGNVAMSQAVDIVVVPDPLSLAVVSAWPTTGMIFTNFGVDHAFIEFNKPITPQSLNPMNMAVLEAGPDGQFGNSDDVPVNLTSLLLSDDDSTVSLSFSALPLGSYQIRLSADRISDRSGHFMGMNSTAATEFKVVPGP